MEGSPKYSLNKGDMKSIAVGAGIAIGGAIVTYASEVVTQVDFGDFTPIVVALAGILINAARKWLAENS